MGTRQTEGPIDSRQLQVFVALAHGGSLKAAARELVVTESAVSHAVRNLEKSVAAKLFRRSGKGLALTESGTILLGESVQILARMRAVRGQLAVEEGAVGGAIRLAAATSFVRCALRGVLEAFRARFPEVAVEVVVADRDQCLELLRKGETTAAITVNVPADSPEIRGVHLFTDQIMALMSARHRLARHARAPVHALCRETIYLRGRQRFTTRMIENEIARWAFQLRNVVYVDSSEATRELARLGLGIAFESPWAFEDRDGDPLVWRPAEGLDLTRRWCFAWPATTEPDLKTRTLLRLCETAGQAIAARGAGREAAAS